MLITTIFLTSTARMTLETQRCISLPSGDMVCPSSIVMLVVVLSNSSIMYMVRCHYSVWQSIFSMLLAIAQNSEVNFCTLYYMPVLSHAYLLYIHTYHLSNKKA